MQEGLPLQDARQAAKSLTLGVSMGAGAPDGTALSGASWVATGVCRTAPSELEAGS
jgi:hypothetical protein